MWWFRDEYLGVIPLGWAVTAQTDSARLRDRCEAELGRRIANLIRFQMTLPWDDVPDDLSARERIDEVSAARRMLPFASTIYWVRSDGADIPVLFFRPAEVRAALYDPALGTAEARVVAPDDTKIVAAIAAKLGYRADSIRREPTETETAFTSPSQFPTPRLDDGAHPPSNYMAR